MKVFVRLFYALGGEAGGGGAERGGGTAAPRARAAPPPRRRRGCCAFNGLTSTVTQEVFVLVSLTNFLPTMAGASTVDRRKN
jgi:hypothetical protein